ncbi:MAG: YdiU family protein [Ottowia sp.]|nr:YdiU family protein [Ottowia sp.]
MATACVTTAPPRLAEPAIRQLGPSFFRAVGPEPLPEPHWVAINDLLARELDLDKEWLASDEALELFSGNADGGDIQPLATVYSGHQFGVWAGQLGDGRALLIGQTPDGQQIQLKGSGRTPYSRGADGRAVLRSSIREYLCSAAMHGLGIPTTRALCIAGSPAPVYRERTETAAVTTRTAPSFIRFGHFEHFSYAGEHRELKTLADFVLDRFYPDCRASEQPYLALLQRVVRKTADLIASWQAAGFMHGVMNTDNMSILGLTLDYGPFQFMDAFDPAHICNHSDGLGRYAYQNQPGIAYWNLRALGHALLPLVPDAESMKRTVQTYEAAFAHAVGQRMAAKLGLAHASESGIQLVTDLLALMARERTDYTIFWHALTQHMAGSSAAPLHDLFVDRAALDAWLIRFETLAQQAGQAHSIARMQRANPAIVLRNHMAQEAIERAEAGDFSLVEELLLALQQPDRAPAGHPEWMRFPPDWAAAIQVSCSS